MKKKTKEFIKKLPIVHQIYSSLMTKREQQAKKEKEDRNLALNEHGFDVMKVIFDALEPLKVKYFFDFGSLLGIIREGKFLGHDTDVDISCCVNELSEFREISKKIDFAVSKVGFQKRHDVYLDGELVVNTYYYKGVSIDFFANLYKDGFDNSFDMYRIANVEYSTKTEASVWRCRRAHTENTKLIEVGHVLVRVPENAEEVLAYEYGEDWRVPNPDWDEFSSPNVIFEENSRGDYKYYQN